MEREHLEWRDIKGFEDQYQVSNYGDFAVMEKEKHIKNIFGNTKSSHSRDSLKIHFLKIILIHIHA